MGSLFSSLLFCVPSPPTCVASDTLIVDGVEKGGIRNEWHDQLSSVPIGSHERFGTAAPDLLRRLRMNNVNVQEMEGFVSTIQEDPAQAKKEKRVTGSWLFQEGKPQFVSTIEYAKGNVVLNAELPPFAGGWGTSPDPVQYCLYGLAACFASTFAAAATSEGVRLTKLEVSAESWMDLRKQMGLSGDNIMEKVKFTVVAAGASRNELERLVNLTKERCPGVECITRMIPLEVESGT